MLYYTCILNIIWVCSAYLMRRTNDKNVNVTHTEKQFNDRHLGWDRVDDGW